MKKLLTILLLLVIATGLMAQRGPFIEPFEAQTICSGEKANYKILAVEVGDQFDWEEEINNSWESLNHSEKSFEVEGNSEVEQSRKIRCVITHTNGQSSITDAVELIIKPLPTLALDKFVACQNAISIFSSNQAIDDGKWLWILNDSDSSNFHTPQFLISDAGRQTIYLEYSNPYGCTSAIVENFETPSTPSIVILNWFNSACGDAKKTLELVNFDSEIHQVEVYCSNNGESIPNAIRSFEILDNDLQILFDRVEDTEELMLEIVITDTSTGCSILLKNRFLLYQERAPEQGSLVKKPNTSFGLVFYNHKYDNEVPDLAYEWGYSWKDSNIPVIVGSGDKNYFDFDSLDSDKTYWVKVYFKDGCQCQTKNELNEN